MGTEKKTEEKKMVSLPTDALGRIKAKERDRGRDEGRKEMATKLDNDAKAAGFGSFTEFMASIGRSMRDRGNGDDDRSDTRSRRDRAPSTPSGKQKARDTDAVREAERRAEEAERRAHHAEFRTAAIAAGVAPDYADFALHLLGKHVESMSDEEASKVDEKVFFAGLRGKFAYLFTSNNADDGKKSEEGKADDKKDAEKIPERGANTSSSGAKDRPGAKGPQAQTPNGEGEVDCTEMTDAEYAEYARSQGW
jgi:hypothetical protein